MKQIQTTTEFVFERTEHGEKFHIRPRFSPDFLCHAPYTFARYEKGPINLDDLCLNCHACNEGYEIVAKKQVEMSNTEPEVPEGYRIMEIGEVLTAECLCWTFAKRWSQYTLSPGSVEGKVGRDHWHICCPIETGEKRDRCQKCGVHQDKVKLVSSEHYHSICNPCLEELHQREFSQNTLVGECDHLQFEYEQANEELCRAQTRIEELEKDRDNWEASSQHNLLRREQLCNENDELQVENSRLDEECSGAKREANEIECKRQYLVSERDELQGQVAYLTAANADDANLQIAVTALREQVAGLEKENLDLIEDRQGLHEDLEDLNAANDELNEDDAKQVELVCRLERENQRLKNSDKAMLDTIAKIDKEHKFKVMACESTISELRGHFRTMRELQDATKGHTLENVKTIMEATPPAEELEGYTLEWRVPEGGEEAWDIPNQSWPKSSAFSQQELLVRTPIIEYLTNEEITDELCKELGRIDCEVQDGHDPARWIGSGRFLIAVNPEEYPPRFLTMRGSREEWRNCRIKKSTIEGLRAKKND